MSSLQTITGGGSFTRANIAAINANFTALQTPDVWVRPQYGNNLGNGSASYPLGSYNNAYATMAGISGILRPGLVVGLQGVLLEEYSSPRVNGVTLLGMGNLPVQATTSGVANGGGSTWLSPTSGTGALLQPNGQGWRIQNIFFNNSATAAGCIKLVNAGDPPTSNCSEKTAVIGCYLTGTDDGINANDLPNNVYVGYNTFFGFSGSGDLGMSSATGAGTGTLQNWVIEYNDFNGNAGHITMPLTSSKIRYNEFSYVYGSVTTTTQIILTNGSNNQIHDNTFAVPFNQNGLTAMFAAGTNDRWAANTMGTACLTPMTGRVWGVPVSGAA